LECPKLKLELDARSLKVKELETKLLDKPRVSVTSPPCKVCGTLKGKLFHATKENTEIKQEVAYLTSNLERTVVSQKMTDDDLNHVEESAIKSTYILSVGFERCEDKGEKSAPMFAPSSNYHKEEETLKSTKTHYPSNPKPSLNPKREVRKETPLIRCLVRRRHPCHRLAPPALPPTSATLLHHQCHCCRRCQAGPWLGQAGPAHRGSLGRTPM
jgi:hypothetical protein